MTRVRRAPCSANTSDGPARVPTIEPMTDVPFSTVSHTGTVGVPSAARATSGPVLDDERPPELMNHCRFHASSSDSSCASSLGQWHLSRSVLQVTAATDQSPGWPGHKQTKVPADRAGTALRRSGSHAALWGQRVVVAARHTRFWPAVPRPLLRRSRRWR